MFPKINCPSCGRIDQVKRVKSIVDEGTTKVHSETIVPVINSDEVRSGRNYDIISYNTYTTYQNVSKHETHYTELAKLLSYPYNRIQDYFVRQLPEPPKAKRI